MKDEKLLVGRSEWCMLPELKIPLIGAKIDTGAKTSAIHAFNIKAVRKNGVWLAFFEVHPLQKNEKTVIKCCAPILDERNIMSSNGHKESRLIIVSKVQLGSKRWDIEISLSNRDPLRYRLLLGRQALNGHVIVDPSLTYCVNKISQKALQAIYKS